MTHPAKTPATDPMRADARSLLVTRRLGPVAPRAPAACGAVPRSLRETSQAQCLTTDPQGRVTSCWATSAIPVSRDYLASPTAARPRASATSARSSATAQRKSGRIPAGRHRTFGRPEHRGGRCRMLTLGLQATAPLRGPRRPKIRICDVGLFAALIAASTWHRLEAAPVRIQHKTSLAHDRRPSSPAARRCAHRVQAFFVARRSTRRPRMRWSPICSRSQCLNRRRGPRSARSRPSPRTGCAAPNLAAQRTKLI